MVEEYVLNGDNFFVDVVRVIGEDGVFGDDVGGRWWEGCV